MTGLTGLRSSAPARSCGVTTVTTTEAKAHLHALLDQVAGSATVTITRRGRAVAVLSAPEEPPRRFGYLAGKVSVPDDFDEALDEDELALWQGGA